MTETFKRSSIPIISVMALMMLAGIVMGADEGISVTGTGTIKGKPTEVLIAGTVSGEGELANDAAVKYRDSKKKATAAIDNLKNPDLSVKADGSEVQEAVDPQQQQRIMQGMGGGDSPKVKVNISERLELTLKNADKMESEKLLETVLKLIDTSRDAGMTIGPPPATNYYQMQIEAQNGGGSALVAFKIPDTSDLQAQAYKLAIADAKSKAQRIADLSEIKLGKIVSVKDEEPNAQQQQWNPWMGMVSSGDHSTPNEATSSKFGEIPITVTLHVQFEIEK